MIPGKIGFIGVYTQLIDKSISLWKRTISTLRNKLSIVRRSPVNHEDLEIFEASTVFFHHRFCDAFPGITSGRYKWFNSSNDINRRLRILLAFPTCFQKAIGEGVTTDPILWFRGTGALPINKFRVLNRKRVLMNIDELKVEKIAAYKGRIYYEDFLYVQCLPDKPTGLYNHELENLQDSFNNDGTYFEEFAKYRRKLITRQEYDDGAAAAIVIIDIASDELINVLNQLSMHIDIIVVL